MAEVLPSEIWTRILLSLEDVYPFVQASLVCKLWNEICQDQQAWKKFCVRRFRHCRVEKFNNNWKEFYITHDNVPKDLSLILIQGTDGNLHLISVDGTSKRLTDDGDTVQYSQPTWSPRGDKIAVTKRTSPHSRSHSSCYLITMDLDGNILSETQTPYPSFYTYWSPDCTRIACLSGSDRPSELGLTYVDLDATEPSCQPLDYGRPFYYSWSPDGSPNILTHPGSKRIEILNVELQIKKSINTRFPVAKFSTPFWKENNNLHTVLFFFFSCPYFKCIYYASKIQNKTYIMKGIVESAPSVNDLQQLSISKLKEILEEKNIEYEGIAEKSALIERICWGFDNKIIVCEKPIIAANADVLCFVCSPDGSRIAYLENHTLYIVNVNEDYTNGENTPIKVESRVIGHFWSPNSRFVLYMCTTGASQPLVWHSYDILNNKITSYQPFHIGAEFYGHYLPFFYQYELNISFISPDSKKFVYCDSSDGVWVTDLESATSTKISDNGEFAVWSPV